MAPSVVCRASASPAAQQAKMPAAATPVQRRTALALLLMPLAAVAPANASAKKNLSRAELLQQQRAERKEAMKVRNAKVRSGEVKPNF
ncbi:hypothetical protein GPECTOR_70g486 [Gonium pectorale]|uniref:Uncharacterized protein n=1 Tax=Gonium pectorale TaxID=33097 RepID=A0A150G411_GONPE|nr:hypothetical protein GPECTOR_70g486 [Gonium pectorale]|eukprot:KXZ44255.1 hypothetical protein GPECTOR_70g486 [Gonium pectorale]